MATADRNNDGVISRAEWQGNRREFNSFDANRDGILSGNELTTAGFVTTAPTGGADRAHRRLDRNASGVLEGNEWPYNPRVFHELDTDSNSVLSPDEFARFSQTATIRELDLNKDGKVTRNEWPGTFATFDQLDQDNNRQLTSDEYFQRGSQFQREQRFREWDTNRNGFLESWEWHSDQALFHQLDRDGDTKVNPQEFYNQQPDRSNRAGRQDRFRDLDANRSGWIEGNEWSANPDVFHRLDTDADSRLSPDEFFATNRDFGYSDLDQNRDGYVSRREWYGDASSFARLDLNRDGYLSQSEMFRARRR